MLGAKLVEAAASFDSITETFPGNLASFATGAVEYSREGARVVIDAVEGGPRPFRSGAFASDRSFAYGRFTLEIRAAAGPGLITGFFLHRGSPRQEIDIEFAGSDPRRMLCNVFFNPGDDGTAMAFGYRGSPLWIDLGFDATEEFHQYALDWRPERVAWIVDGRIVHERASWDPTPIPHLGMRLHANLWAPRSQELAGRIDRGALPASAGFRDLVVAE
jgi:beta-glucanase (GH16 family)